MTIAVDLGRKATKTNKQTKQLVDTTFWLKPWLKLISFRSNFSNLALKSWLQQILNQGKPCAGKKNHCWYIFFPFLYCFILFVWFDASCPGQQFFSHVVKGLPGLNQFYAADKVSFSRTQYIDFPSGESRTTCSNPLIPSLMLYQLRQCAPHLSILL